ncbi:MAG TPA: DUF2961 domain-containing protein [Polyangia bacterium]|nr:DUF2961 domain-containing protein [Polyangia bacterium]
MAHSDAARIFTLVACLSLTTSACGRLKPNAASFDASGPAAAEVGSDAAGDGDGAGTVDGAEAALATLSPILADWPRVRVGVESREFSSFDRTGGNDDGFAGTYSALYVDAKGEQVIFDALGPGRLDTLWFTSSVSGTAPLGIGRVRFYLDGAATPAATADADQLFAGGVPGFPPSLVFDNHESTGGFVSYVPIPFARRLRITTERRASFYSAQYETFPPDEAVASWSPDDPVDARALGLVPDADADDGDEAPLDTERAGPGLVTRLTFLPAGPVAADALRAARVRIWWEDEAEPGVDCPVDAFFGSGLGEASVASLAFSMAPGRWVSHLPMPFWRRARVQLTGVSGRLFLRVAPNPYDESQAAHLRVRWREERPTTPATDFELLTYAGAGRLVATVLTVEPPDAATDKQWWEGDLRSYADGRRTPGIQGTGYEDDHFGGWSNEFFSTPFSLPLNGEPLARILDHTGQYNGDVTMYRVWRGIPFLGEVRHSVEHGTENVRQVNESAATFFYAEPRPWLVDSDALDVCDDASRAAHALSVAGETRLPPLASAFEGRAYQTTVTMCHHAHTGRATFTLAVSPDNAGVILRRAYDQARGRQRAAVSVDGAVAGTWYVAESNETLRWAERDFFLPPSVTRGRARLAITIEPQPEPDLAGDPPAWDAAAYRTLSVVPPAVP